MKRIILISLLLSISAICFSQYNYQHSPTSNPTEDRMAVQTKLKYSRMWKIVGLSLLSTGLYLGNTKQNPQRIDVPMIVFGAVLTIEGIRLGHNNVR